MYGSTLRRTIWCLLAASLVASPGTASARSSRDLAYQSEVAWMAAVRLLRVDLGFQIVERDQDARFVLFQYVEGQQSHPGSMEIVERTLEDGRIGVRVVVAVPALPTYVELNLIDRLERKLREEVGPPAPLPPREHRRLTSRSSDDDHDEDADEDDHDGDRHSDDNDDDDDDNDSRHGRSHRRSGRRDD